MFFLLSNIYVFADTHTSIGSGDWSTAGSWTPAGPPAAGDNVIIASGHTITLNANFAANANITINSDGILNVGVSKGNVNIVLTINNGGTLTNSGILNVGESKSNGNNILTINNGGTLTNKGILNVGESKSNGNNILTIINGGTLINNGTINVNAKNPLHCSQIINNGIFTNNGTLNNNKGSLSHYGLTTNNATFNIPMVGGSAAGSIGGEGVLKLNKDLTITYSGTGASATSISCQVVLGDNRVFNIPDNGISAAYLLISGVISGAYSITKSGDGTLNLSGENTFSGGSVLNTGNLILSNVKALGAPGSSVTLNGGVLELKTNSTVNTYNYNVTIGGYSVINSDRSSLGAGITHVLGNLTMGEYSITTKKGSNVTSGTAVIQFGGDFTMTGNATIISETSDVHISGTSSGTYKLTKSGAGTLKKITDGWSLGADFEITDGAYDANNFQTTVTGLTTLSGGSYNSGTAQQTLTGGLLVSGGTYEGLSGTAGRTTVSNVTINSGTLSAPGSTGTFNVSGDWSKNGGSFTHNNGTVVFNSSLATQTIGGSESTIFYNLTINNKNTDRNNIVLGVNNIQVNSILNLTKGALNLNNKLLIINNTSTTALTRGEGYIYSESLSDGSTTSAATPYNSVLGRVQWNIGSSTGTYSFLFGKSSAILIPFIVQITNAGTVPSTGNITASTYATSSENYPYPSYPNTVTEVKRKGIDNSAYVVDRFWSMELNGYSSNPVYTLSFYFDPLENPIISTASLKAQSWYNSKWNDPISGTGNGTNYVSGILGGNSSEWALVDEDNPLPVELKSFNTELVDQTSLLEWTTFSETNNEYFTIEKSIDGKEWKSYSIVKGAGNSNSTVNYLEKDSKPYNPITYYRLSQTDFDGTTEILGIRSVSMKEAIGEEMVKIYPNPAVNIAYCEINSESEKSILLKIINMFGQITFSDEVAINKGANKIPINIESLQGGSYLVLVEDEFGVPIARKKLIVK